MYTGRAAAEDTGHIDLAPAKERGELVRNAVLIHPPISSGLNAARVDPILTVRACVEDRIYVHGRKF